jgi:hypothetical protein
MVVAALLNVSASFMNGGAGTGMVDFFHGFQVALMMTVMLNLTQFVWWRCKQSRRGSCLQVHTPTLWTLASTILVNIQPMWILIIGSWKLCCGTNAQMGFNDTTNPAGWSYAPWPSDPNTPRPCSAPGGNVFWDNSYCTGQRLSTFPSVASGWAVQIVFTWGGFVCMFIGILQATQLHVKLKKQWRLARQGR